MRTKLDSLSAGIDRTASMGLFPHHEVQLADVDDVSVLMRAAQDESESLVDRDQAMWNLVYRQESARNRELPDLLMEVARSDRSESMRRSSAWALMKIGERGLLEQCLSDDDDDNVVSWKQHLIYEAQGRTDYFDPRPVRLVDSEFGYGLTMPLTIHGLVEFRTYKYRGDGNESGQQTSGGYGYRSRGGRAESTEPSRRAASAGYGGRSRPGAFPNPASRTAALWASAGSGYETGRYEWHALVAGPQAQRALVGDLTASVTAETFYDNLVIQKRVTDLSFSDAGHVMGYLFTGMSRMTGDNVMAHYYHSEGPQPFYLSGRIGDESEGVIQVPSMLMRHAETNIVTNDAIPFPYVQSVRGLFYGPAHMNPVVVEDPGAPLNRLLQIVQGPQANGWFYGEFRSVPVDVDGDGTVELNGIEMFVDTKGHVAERTPPAIAAPGFVR